MSTITSFIQSLITEADKVGCAEVAEKSGLYIQTSDDLISCQREWGEDDGFKREDFTGYRYWLTTDDGQDPYGFDGPDDDFIQKIVGQYAEKA